MDLDHWTPLGKRLFESTLDFGALVSELQLIDMQARAGKADHYMFATHIRVCALALEQAAGLLRGTIWEVEAALRDQTTNIGATNDL